MHFKVAIVGAGAAGLTAADKISRAGHSVAVIEARSRTGGRIHTLTSPFMAEAGAEFIHGTPPATLQLLEESHHNFTKVDGKIYSIYANEPSLGDPHEDEREKFVKVLGEIKNDTTVAHILKTNVLCEK
jgi:monoamine oxidase